MTSLTSSLLANITSFDSLVVSLNCSIRNDNLSSLLNNLVNWRSFDGTTILASFVIPLLLPRRHRLLPHSAAATSAQGVQVSVGASVDDPTSLALVLRRYVGEKLVVKK